MFSELCRETLRRAAVCYSAGRTGSPSPSPPTSPPPSPAKEAKTAANAQLANVGDTYDEHCKDGGRVRSTTAAATSHHDVRECTGRKSPPTYELKEYGKRKIKYSRVFNLSASLLKIIISVNFATSFHDKNLFFFFLLIFVGQLTTVSFFL